MEKSIYNINKMNNFIDRLGEKSVKYVWEEVKSIP